MDIIGGNSFVGCIKVMSDEFLSTAKYDEKGIVIKVKRNSFLSRILRKSSNLPIPRLAILVLFVWDSMGIVGKTIFVYALAATFGLLDGIHNQVWATEKFFMPIIEKYQHQIVFLLKYFNWVIYLAAIVYISKSVAKWHGAEHMAIASYNKNKENDIEKIKQESRIDPRCGGRFVVPMMVIAFVASIITNHYAIIFELICLEILLWIDKFYGLYRIPIISHTSIILQKYITTAQPSETELYLAYKAIRALKLAHGISKSS